MSLDECAVSPGESQWSRWDQVSPSGFKSIQVRSNEPRCIQVGLSEFKWAQEVASETKRSRVTPCVNWSEATWIQERSSDSEQVHEWDEVRPSKSKGDQVRPSGAKMNLTETQWVVHKAEQDQVNASATR